MAVLAMPFSAYGDEIPKSARNTSECIDYVERLRAKAINRRETEAQPKLSDIEGTISLKYDRGVIREYCQLDFIHIRSTSEFGALASPPYREGDEETLLRAMAEEIRACARTIKVIFEPDLGASRQALKLYEEQFFEESLGAPSTEGDVRKNRPYGASFGVWPRVTQTLKVNDTPIWAVNLKAYGTPAACADDVLDIIYATDAEHAMELGLHGVKASARAFCSVYNQLRN
jgi:hypothetical protein